MTELIWRGGADAIAQISTITVTGTWATNDTATLTIGGYTLTLTVGTDTTTANIATALKEMFNGDAQTGTGDHTFSNTGDEIQPMNEIAATVNSSTVTFTHATAGKPFTLTVGETTAGTGSLGSVTTSTAATGPDFWSNAENWSTGSVPVSSDDVVIDGRSNWDIKYGLDQSAVALTSLTIKNSYTKTIGLPEINKDNAAENYPEYRDTYLQVQTSTLTIEGEGTGSGRIKIDLGSATATTMNISSRGNTAEQGIPALLILGTNASNIARVTRGDVGFAFYEGGSAHLATLDVGFEDNQAGNSTVRCGDGVDLTNATVTQSGGSLTIETTTSSGTITQSGGTLYVLAGAHAQIDVDGTLYYSGAGTLTTLNISGGTVDFRRGAQAVTVTNCVISRQSTLLDPAKRVTFTNGIDVTRCGLNELQEIDLGKHFTIQRSAI